MKALLLCAFVLSSAHLRGMDVHPYSITHVRADLHDNRIVMTIRTNAEDLLYFHKLPFDSLLRISSQNLVASARAHASVIESAFFILNQDGIRMPSSVTSSDFSSLEKSESIDAMFLLKYPLVYTLEFVMDKATEILNFHQHLGTAGTPAVSFLTISRNANTLVTDVELSRDKPFTMIRDAISINATDRQSFMVSYITLSDTRVVHELTIPSEILQSFLSIDGASEQSSEAIRKFISENSTVRINDIDLHPQITALVLGTESSPQRYNSSAAHIRIEYSLEALPKKVAISWDNFNWKMRWFKSLIDAFGQRREHNFSRFQPTLTIERDLRLDKK